MSMFNVVELYEKNGRQALINKISIDIPLKKRREWKILECDIDEQKNAFFFEKEENFIHPRHKADKERTNERTKKKKKISYSSKWKRRNPILPVAYAFSLRWNRINNDEGRKQKKMRNKFNSEWIKENAACGVMMLMILSACSSGIAKITK